MADNLIDPVFVYLDSSDFSLLSNVRHQTDNILQISQKLRDYAKSKNVIFLFSGVHLSEMAPIGPEHAEFASMRTNFMVDLCGRNALLSFDKILKMELLSLCDRIPDIHDVFSSDAEWFPDIEDIMNPVDWTESIGELNKEGVRIGLNRQQRRYLAKKVFSGKHPSDWSKACIIFPQLSSMIKSATDLYPMRDCDARILIKYILGLSTKSEAKHAFLESLRDPKWMMKWFEKHHSDLTPVIEWFRSPSKKLMDSIRVLTQTASMLEIFEQSLGVAKQDRSITKKFWMEWQNAMIVDIVRNIGEKLSIEVKTDVDCEKIDLHCPGISCLIRSLHSSMLSSVGKTPRKPKDSDVVDSVHSIYAPYVDVFRADSYMSTFITTSASKSGTKVVSRLENIIDAIETKILTKQKQSFKDA